MTAVTTIASGRGPYEQTHTILGASAASGMSVTGTTSETILATVQIPGGAMGANGIIRVTSLWSMTSSANTKTLTWRFGAAGAGIGGTTYSGTPVTTSSLFHDMRLVRNITASTQKGLSSGNPTGGLGVSSGALVTSSVNTANAAEVAFTATLTNTGETITLESYLVELIRVD